MKVYTYTCSVMMKFTILFHKNTILTDWLTELRVGCGYNFLVVNESFSFPTWNVHILIYFSLWLFCEQINWRRVKAQTVFCVAQSPLPVRRTHAAQIIAKIRQDCHPLVLQQLPRWWRLLLLQKLGHLLWMSLEQQVLFPLFFIFLVLSGIFFHSWCSICSGKI